MPKVLLFLVEGPSDAAALEHVMQQLLDPAKIRFHALRADITAMRQPAAPIFIYDLPILAWWVGNASRICKFVGIAKWAAFCYNSSHPPIGHGLFILQQAARQEGTPEAHP